VPEFSAICADALRFRAIPARFHGAAELSSRDRISKCPGSVWSAPGPAPRALPTRTDQDELGKDGAGPKRLSDPARPEADPFLDPSDA